MTCCQLHAMRLAPPDQALFQALEAHATQSGLRALSPCLSWCSFGLESSAKLVVLWHLDWTRFEVAGITMHLCVHDASGTVWQGYHLDWKTP